MVKKLGCEDLACICTENGSHRSWESYGISGWDTSNGKFSDCRVWPNRWWWTQVSHPKSTSKTIQNLRTPKPDWKEIGQNMRLSHPACFIGRWPPVKITRNVSVQTCPNDQRRNHSSFSWNNAGLSVRSSRALAPRRARIFTHILMGKNILYALRGLNNMH